MLKTDVGLIVSILIVGTTVALINARFSEPALDSAA